MRSFMTASFFPVTPNIIHVWVIDQVWGQDGWILAEFFFCVLWTETKSRSINSRKKIEANIQSSWPNKLVQLRICYMTFGKFFLRDVAGSPARARWLHLARSSSQSQRRICFILPARGASHIIIWVIDQGWGQDGWILARCCFCLVWIWMWSKRFCMWWAN